MILNLTDNQRRVGELIRSLQERLAVTSVVVTHELELCFGVSDRVGLLQDGRIVETGTSEAMRRSGHPAVQAFLSGARDGTEEEEAAARLRAAVPGGSDGS